MSSSRLKFPFLIFSSDLTTDKISWLATLGGFPSRFSKCFFHSCTLSSLLVALSLAEALDFLSVISLTVFQASTDLLLVTEFLM